MRVWFRKKIRCPSSTCFSAQQRYTPSSAPVALDLSAEKEKQELVVVVDGTELFLKSSIKRRAQGQEAARKKAVQWLLGRALFMLRSSSPVNPRIQTAKVSIIEDVSVPSFDIALNKDPINH